VFHAMKLSRPNKHSYRSRRVIFTLILIAIIGASVRRNHAQVIVPSAASLDVQITATPTQVTIGTDSHIAYELHITNYRTSDVALTRVEVIGGGRDGRLLASYEGPALATRLARVGARPDGSDKRIVGAGMHVVVFIWLDLADASSVARGLRHRISYHLADRTGADETSTVEAGATSVRQQSSVVLAAPVRGGPWAALYDPSSIFGHRRAFFAIDGKARIPARFAIDWVKLGHDGHVFHDDRSIPANYYGYGADVLAVADGVVASAVDRYPEPTSPITFENEAGNYVAINIGGGRFAFYEHLQPGSIRAKVGDRVHSGDLLARLGASGSVFSGPHLHFHVSDANSPLGAEGIPFVFRRFELLGAFESLDAFAEGKTWSPAPRETVGLHRLEMPPAQGVLRF
jgi:Peptidase family M23